MARFTRSRRGFLRVAGVATVVGVAGCTTGDGGDDSGADDGGDGDDTEGAESDEELPEGVSAEENTHDGDVEYEFTASNDELIDRLSDIKENT